MAMKIVKVIDKYMFLSKHGVTYTWWNKVNSWLGIGLVIYGCIGVVINSGVDGSPEMLLPVTLGLFGAMIILATTLSATKKRLKEVCINSGKAI